MIERTKLEHALRAIHEILVLARLRAGETGDQQLYDLLDAAEILPKYIAEPADRTSEFRQAIKDLEALCPNSAFISQHFESAYVEPW